MLLDRFLCICIVVVSCIYSISVLLLSFFFFFFFQAEDGIRDLTVTGVQTCALPISYLFSDDGGSTWSKPMPLSDRPFHAGYGNDTGQPNIGDYIQAVAQNGALSEIGRASCRERV